MSNRQENCPKKEITITPHLPECGTSHYKICSIHRKTSIHTSDIEQANTWVNKKTIICLFTTRVYYFSFVYNTSVLFFICLPHQCIIFHLFTTPVPSGPPQLVQCSPTSPTSLSLSWQARIIYWGVLLWLIFSIIVVWIPYKYIASTPHSTGSFGGLKEWHHPRLHRDLQIREQDWRWIIIYNGDDTNDDDN